jgi:carboxypeptidase C (cathepsin A)
MLTLRALVVVLAGAAVAWGQPRGREHAERSARPEERGAAADQQGPERSERDSDDGKDEQGKNKKRPEPSTTHHSVTIGGREIAYTATAGSIEMTDYDGKPKAEVFYIAYTKDRGGEGEDAGTPDRSRPVTFAYNGGPGSSSVWLHMGALGPRRVEFAEKGRGDDQRPEWPSPPYRLVDNEYSWLDVTDLVFIDPVSTGYSRPVEGESKDQFHGLQEDIQWVGDFIRLWLTREERWLSPKFLAGESYGTTRSAGLSGYLMDAHGIYLNGITLVSPVLNFQTISFDAGNDTAYWLFLPTYTATAWYHDRLPPELQRDLQAALREAERFAGGDYLLALAKGDALTEQDRERVAAGVARLTGLSARYVLDSNLRVNIFNFTKELLRDERRTVGRYDSRYTGTDRNSIGASAEYDPSYAVVLGAFGAAVNAYLREDLGYKDDRPYEILTGRVQPWSYASASNRYADVAETLRSAMTRNPAMRVLVASGYFDLATPYYAATYTIDHLGLAPALRDHIQQTYYGAGHMMYLRHADLAKLKDDAARFYGAALPPARPAVAGGRP